MTSNRHILLEQLRRETLDIFNRLHSISEDIAFVNTVAQSYSRLPLLPNLRCGAWYTDPKISANIPAYFKSTDGHYNNWSFNLRRPNLHLLPVVIENQGLILVDSTRAGKRIPDALSKTIAIWCCVINRAMLKAFPEVYDAREWNTKLYTPPGAVSAQEHHQIELRIDGWADLLSSSAYILPQLPKPLRPLWITPSTPTFPTLFSEYLPVVCVSASKQVSEGMERRSSSFVYVQGSGDDHELWGEGLTPKIFWEHKEILLKTDRSSLLATIERIVEASHSSPDHLKSQPTPIQKTGILIAAIHDILPLQEHSGPAYVLISSTTVPIADNPKLLLLQAPEGKKGQHHFLIHVLPQSIAFIKAQLYNGTNVCVACDTGRDHSIGVALTALQCFYDDEGVLLQEEEGNSRTSESLDTVSKSTIRTRLQWIISSRPAANPSRATLKRVNEFLLSSPTIYPQARSLQ